MAHSDPTKTTGRHYSKSENKRRARMGIDGKKDIEELLTRLSNKANTSKFKYPK